MGEQSVGRRLPPDAPRYFTIAEVAAILHREKKWLERIILEDEALKQPRLAETYYHLRNGHRLWDQSGIHELLLRLAKPASTSSFGMDTGTSTEQSGLETADSALDEVLGSQQTGRGAKRRPERARKRRASSRSSSTAEKRQQHRPMLQPVT